jgi:vacuolar iron transporter family protein
VESPESARTGTLKFRRKRAPQTRQEAVRELRRIKQHHAQGTAGGRLRAAIFGMNDGLVTNASLVVGVAAAEPGRQIVVLAGIAGLVAGAVSMAAGEYISMTVQREMFESQIALERRELVDDPEGERHEVAVMFRAKGIEPNDAERIADSVMEQPEVALDLMAREELGLNPDDLGSPWGAAISSFGAFAVGAAVPLVPYIFLGGTQAMMTALVLAGVVMMTVGGVTARITQHAIAFGALRALIIGALATGVTYAVGRLVGVAVT